MLVQALTGVSAEDRIAFCALLQEMATNQLILDYAVPSWELAADRGLVQADIQFG